MLTSSGVQTLYIVISYTKTGSGATKKIKEEGKVRRTEGGEGGEGRKGEGRKGEEGPKGWGPKRWGGGVAPSRRFVDVSCRQIGHPRAGPW